MHITPSQPTGERIAGDHPGTIGILDRYQWSGGGWWFGILIQMSPQPPSHLFTFPHLFISEPKEEAEPKRVCPSRGGRGDGREFLCYGDGVCRDVRTVCV